MNVPASAAHDAPMRVLPHIKRLDECFGDFLVRVTLRRIPAHGAGSTRTDRW
jgi:hypothetical protein